MRDIFFSVFINFRNSFTDIFATFIPTVIHFFRNTSFHLRLLTTTRTFSMPMARDRSIIETVFCVAGRAIGHERDQEGKYPLEGGCERGGEGHGVESKGGIMDSHQQQFCLKWNSFGSNLATTFSNLFKSESLTDVTLFCEGKFLICDNIYPSLCT